MDRPCLRQLAVISALYWGAVWLLHPFPGVPLNDDWTYAAAVFDLLRTGRMRLSDWTVASQVVQILWGALFSALLGSGYGALRASTLVLAWLGGISFHLFLRRNRIGEGQESALTLLLLFNPLYFVLSPSFMTDVPALSLSLAAVLLYWEGVGRPAPSWGWTAAGSVAAALAAGIRQPCLLLPAGVSAYVLCRGRRDWRLLACVWGAPLLAAAAYALWRGGHEPTANLYLRLWDGSPTQQARWPLLLGLRLGSAALYAGLFAVPLAVGLCLGRAPRLAGLGRGWKLGLLAAALLLALFLLLGGRLPYPSSGLFGTDLFHECNYLGAAGLGCFNIDGSKARHLPLLGSAWFWKGLSLAGAASFLCLLASGREAPPAASFLALTLGLEFIPPLLGASFFDRYMLPWVPIALVLGADMPSSRLGRRGFWAAACLTLLFSWAGTADYLRATETAWGLGREAAALGFKEEEVRASLDWCWAHEWEARARELREGTGGRPFLAKDVPMSCLSAPRAGVSFREEFRAPAHRPLSSAGFFSPLAWRSERLHLHELFPEARP